MKCKFLAIALSILALSSIEAKNAKALTPKKSKFLLGKDKAQISFFGAEDTSPITFVGATTTFTPITFTQDQLSHGNAITPNGASSQFLLQEGTYKISFTGTFQSSFPPSFWDIALQVGKNTIFINSDSKNFLPLDSFAISFVDKVIEVDKPTHLSIVARNTATGASVVLTTRSIIIQKL